MQKKEFLENPDLYEVTKSNKATYFIYEDWLLRKTFAANSKFTLIANFTAMIKEKQGKWLEIEMTHLPTGKLQNVTVHKRDFSRMGWVTKAGLNYVINAGCWASVKDFIRTINNEFTTI